MRPFIFAVLMLGLAPAALLAETKEDKVYAWTDADGVTHYSQTPPAREGYREVGVKHDAEAEAAAQAATTEADAAAEAEAAAAAKAKSDEQNCALARNNLTVLTEQANLRLEGEEADLDAERREAMLATARDQIARFCGQ